MSLTNATYQRSIDLAGEIKQARDVVTECDRAEEEKRQAYYSAQADTQAARARLAEKLQEREQLAAKAHADVMQAGEETPPAVECAQPGVYPSVFDLDGQGLSVHVTDGIGNTFTEIHANGHARVADSELPEF